MEEIFRDIKGYEDSTHKQKDIGQMFGIGSRAISKINTGIRWGWL